MTDKEREELRQRYVELHKALDELAAAWIAHQSIASGKLFSNTSIMELMEWSHEQTKNPTLPGEVP